MATNSIYHLFTRDSRTCLVVIFMCISKIFDFCWKSDKHQARHEKTSWKPHHYCIVNGPGHEFRIQKLDSMSGLNIELPALQAASKKLHEIHIHKCFTPKSTKCRHATPRQCRECAMMWWEFAELLKLRHNSTTFMNYVQFELLYVIIIAATHWLALAYTPQPWSSKYKIDESASILHIIIFTRVITACLYLRKGSLRITCAFA